MFLRRLPDRCLSEGVSLQLYTECQITGERNNTKDNKITRNLRLGSCPLLSAAPEHGFDDSLPPS